MKLPADFEIARRLPPPGSSLEPAQDYTRWLAKHHYENFTVASYLLPRHLRQHFYNVYAYCRWADDLADEVSDPENALELLNWWGEELRRYADWAAVVDYCRYSANPVGRLVLYLGGYRDQERQKLSDFTCTALQLA